jgi:hypothetical protein
MIGLSVLKWRTTLACPSGHQHDSNVAGQRFCHSLIRDALSTASGLSRRINYRFAPHQTILAFARKRIRQLLRSAPKPVKKKINAKCVNSSNSEKLTEICRNHRKQSAKWISDRATPERKSAPYTPLARGAPHLSWGRTCLRKKAKEPAATPVIQREELAHSMAGDDRRPVRPPDLQQTPFKESGVQCSHFCPLNTPIVEETSWDSEDGL